LIRKELPVRRSFALPFAALLTFATSVLLLPPAASAMPPSSVVADAGKAGVLATVRTRLDTWEIPHIFGTTDRDVLYGLGRAHARDRFFRNTSPYPVWPRLAVWYRLIP
jgi:acyl-homoserine lactone acylase PvdQ